MTSLGSSRAVFAHKNGGVRVVEQIAGKVRQLQNDLFGDVGVPFCRDNAPCRLRRLHAKWLHGLVP
jgi:hypothetical protein